MFEGDAGWFVGSVFQVGLQGSQKGYFQNLVPADHVVFSMVRQTSSKNFKGDLLLFLQPLFWLNTLVKGGLSARMTSP